MCHFETCPLLSLVKDCAPEMESDRNPQGSVPEGRYGWTKHHHETMLRERSYAIPSWEEAKKKTWESCLHIGKNMISNWNHDIFQYISMIFCYICFAIQKNICMFLRNEVSFACFFLSLKLRGVNFSSWPKLWFFSPYFENIRLTSANQQVFYQRWFQHNWKICASQIGSFLQV